MELPAPSAKSQSRLLHEDPIQRPVAHATASTTGRSLTDDGRSLPVSARRSVAEKVNDLRCASASRQLQNARRRSGDRKKSDRRKGPPVTKNVCRPRRPRRPGPPPRPHECRSRRAHSHLWLLRPSPSQVRPMCGRRGRRPFCRVFACLLTASPQDRTPRDAKIHRTDCGSPNTSRSHIA
jgi:hypothetical protein